ncbi:hypothetical protein [Acidovorax sp. SRB_24]|uniref:hypothetical protein n=1 Tax=Acidovorax sp. SRB_24 TaxID=1962700 RepID=UPI00197B9EB2|nr:hypothetical protein [Acidovorax sp. SRB_24]NMM75391.1 hypothetical protein [Acidovorax sp. SRB_24]
MPNADSVGALATELRVSVPTLPNRVLRGAGFRIGSDEYRQMAGDTVMVNPSPASGGGTQVGSVASTIGRVSLVAWGQGSDPEIKDWRGLLVPPAEGVASPYTAFQTVFRTATAPIRPGSLSVLGTMQDGTTFNITAGVDGKINGTRVKGLVDYEFGLVRLYFVDPNGPQSMNTDLSGLGIAGLTSLPRDLVLLNSLRYNAVAYSYLPLNAELLGIDPVRLPSDGRVPIFRPGGFAVVGHTGKITASVSNGQTIDCARVRLSRVRVLGSDKKVINTGYTADLDAGKVAFTDVTSYKQPVTIEHRIEDMAVVRDVQISGEISFTRALTHAYPASGSHVSSALMAGDLKSRVSVFFDQTSWDGVTWSDTVVGNVAVASYNDVLAPVVVTNAGAVTERWALRFTNSTSFDIIGEHVGVVGTGSINTTTAPLNPATNTPYFSMSPLGWGTGWAAGNVVRMNTVGAMFPVWVVRTVQQGAESVQDDSFTLLVRGDVDRP